MAIASMFGPGRNGSAHLVVLRLAQLSAVLCALSLGCPPARAEPGAVPEGYTDLIDEAVNEASQSHFEEARALFARAHALYPNARTLRGLGIMAYELRSYVESISFYEQALLASERPLDAALRADAQAQIARARRFVAEVRLSLTPPEVRCSLDDQVRTLDPAGVLRLDAGTHTLKFEAPGYRSETRTLDVRGGELIVWTVALRLSEVAPVLASAAKSEVSATEGARPVVAQRDQQPRRIYRNPWLWTGVALAAGAIAVGVGMALRPDPKTVREAPEPTRQSPSESVIYTLLRRP